METFFQSPKCQRVPLSLTARPRRETEAPSPEHPALPPSSSVMLRMVERLESDFHPVPERPSQLPAELWLVFALVVKELISHSLRLPTPGTRLEERETTGQELEVLL